MNGIRVARIGEMPRLGKSGIRVPKPPSPSCFFHVHAHSAFSYQDALPQVKDMVQLAKQMGQPALALTDHGNMAGSVQLYNECSKAGILPFPGSELYLVHDRADKKAKRYHVGVLAHSTEGYEALVRLSSRSHSRDNFHHKPLVDFADLAEWKQNGWTQGLALTTGCYFGMLIQTLLSQGPEAAKGLLLRFAALFPHTFVEVQRHDIEQNDGLTEGQIAEALFGLAQECGLPMVLAQDAHYCAPGDQAAHDTLKRLVAFGPDADDAVFPGDGFHLCDESWIRAHHTDDHWRYAQQGHAHLLDLHSLGIPALDRYHYNIPLTVPDPDKELLERCRDELANRGLGQKYSQRLFDELDIIHDTGMAGYLLLVAEVTDWCQREGVFYQARGSASGSMATWLLGITQIDPIKYKLGFERFISRDRTKPPDIDLDVEDTRRADLIAYLNSRFNVCQIGTWAEYTIKPEEDPRTGKKGRGSLLVSYLSRARRSGADKEWLDAIQGLADLPAEDQAELIKLSSYGMYKSYGVHAAGLVVTTTKDEFDRLVPTMLVASSDTTVTQYDMDDIEKLGLVKLDALGLRTLSVLRRTVELLGRSVKDGLDFIPLSDTATFTRMRNGATAGVFQLEGGTTTRGCREMGVRSLKDIIVIMALYRPAVMSSGGKDTYLRRREGVERAPDRHGIIQKNLAETFGLPVFQEQVVGILRDLGMSPDDLTAFLKAVKASQKAEIEKARITIKGYREQLWRMADGHGMEVADFEFLWEAIEGFAQYGFNRAHATAYGLTAYRCAYLATHHSLEFFTAILETVAGKPKELEYIQKVRKLGIRLLSPDVNVSTHTWTIDRQRKAIRRGLVTIKGVGEKAAKVLADNAPYASVEDIIERCPARPVSGGRYWAKRKELAGVLKALEDAGALESIWTKE